MSETVVCKEAPASGDDSVSKGESLQSSAKRKEPDTNSSSEETSNKKVCTEANVDKNNHDAGSTDEKLKSEDNNVTEADKNVPPDSDTAVTKTETCKEYTHKKLSMPETTPTEDATNSCDGGKKEDATSKTKDVIKVEPLEETCDKDKPGNDTSTKIAEKPDSEMSEKKDNNQNENPYSALKDAEKQNDAVTKKSNSREKEQLVDQSSKKMDMPKAAANVNGVASEKALKAVVDNSNSDSDKENGDCPMDLSTGNKIASESSPDVIMLSDDDIDMSNDISKMELTPQQLKERRHLVKRLKEELRNEDAKLVLLKKIRQSQLMQHLHDTVPVTNKQASRHQTQTVPPPLVRSGLQQQQQQQQHAHNKVNAHANSSIQMMRGLAHTSHARSLPAATHAQQGPPPLIMASRHSTPNAAAPMGILGLRGLSTNSQQSLMSGYRQQVAPVVPEQTPAQRQAAAKLALRKQLEKTLLQIPPPKPPPPEMNFMPSLAGNEFIMLAGLEEVVKHIVDIDARARGERRPEVKYVFNPFVCVQCGTDFTPVWKRDKPGSKCVICELCVTTNQKKALKQEHTNRLKSAFVKALQQEQEIEQRIQAQSSAAATVTTTAPLAHHSVTHTSAPMNLTTNFKPTTEQMRHHQNLIEAHQAQLRSGGPLAAAFNPRMAFPFSASALTKADLQRQYLLDMIPRSMPGGTVLWRT